MGPSQMIDGADRMDQKIFTSLLTSAKKIAVEAGGKILANTPKPGEINSKADGSPVTRADLASHHCIITGLSKLGPRLPIISEESDPDEYKDKLRSCEHYWLVDPLDGTKDFLKGNGEYTVNIALVHKSEPLMGVIYAPALDILYYAAQGTGAWKVMHSKKPVLLTGPKKKDHITAVISRSHPSAKTENFLARNNIHHCIKSGSSLKMCLIADGKADIYPRFGPTSLWDTAAGCTIAREAGCRVVDLEGKDLHYEICKNLLHSGFLVYSPETFIYKPLP